MSIASLSITSFGITPDLLAEAPDVYSEGGLDKLAKPADIQAEPVEESFIESMTPKQVTEFLNNPKVKEYAESSKQTMQEVAAEIKSALPNSNNDLGEVMDTAGDGDIIGVFKQAKRLKESTPSSLYNNIEKDVFAKTMEFSEGITSQVNPLGDYLCKKRSAELSGDKGFDLDKAIQAALKGAKLALAALGKCGYDSVSAIDDMSVTDGLKIAIGLTVAEDGSKNGVVDSTANLFTRFKDSVPVTTAVGWAHNLAGSFMPGESTLPDETDVFADTLTDMCPDFALEGSPARTSLMSKMKDETLDVISDVDGLSNDAILVKMARGSGETDLESMGRAHGVTV